MIIDNQIDCTVHWVVDGKNHERIGVVPNRDAAYVMARLIDQLNLKNHLQPPTESVPTLHAERHSPPLLPGKTLGELGIHDGSHLWLILTPQYLPLTVDWIAGGKQGRKEFLLPTHYPVHTHLRTMVQSLGLQDWIDGPTRSIATLSDSNNVVFEPERTLLELDLRERAQLILRINPSYLPITLHSSEGGQEEFKLRYLSVTKSIKEHLDELAAQLLAQPEHKADSILSLRVSPSGKSLPMDQTLIEAGIKEQDHLWFVITPTVIDLKVYYPHGETTVSQQLAISFAKPLNDVVSDLVAKLGLPTDRVFNLHQHPDSPAWPPSSTLAAHSLQSGDQIWLLPKPKRSIPLFIPLFLLAMIILMGLFIFLRGSSTDAPPIEVGTTVAQSTPGGSTQTEVGTPLPATHQDPQEQKRLDYIIGQEAYAKQDWKTAGEAFKRVYAIDPAYLDLINIGSATYYNWAFNSLTSAETANDSLILLKEAFLFKPDHQPGKNLEAFLEAYLVAQTHMSQQEWDAAIAELQKARQLGLEFSQKRASLGVLPQLYDALLTRGSQLEAADTPAARALYGSAIELENEDANLNVSEARERLAAITPTAIPATNTPRPTPAALKRLRFKEAAQGVVDPTCFAVHIDTSTINTVGWYVTVDGLGLRGNIDAAGHGNVCGLSYRQEVTFTVWNAQGQPIPGGQGIPTIGSALMNAPWR